MSEQRCPWSESSALARVYHDEEWGVPVHDDHKLFEFLILEGAQAGLSWDTILRKRDHYRAAFSGFDPSAVARYGDTEAAALLANAGIVRNRLKIAAAIANARAVCAIRQVHGSLDRYLWAFAAPISHQPRRSAAEVPSATPESDTMSRELRRHGLSFVGSTICYAFMQAVGMVNDHLMHCYRYREIIRAHGPKARPRTAPRRSG
jgi:DNA-3-methyladenine glycosylase I